MAYLKDVYASEAEVIASRKGFGKSLDELKLWYESMSSIEAPYKAVGSVQPFLLAYQNYNNLDLLKRYGALCATFMATLPEAHNRRLTRWQSASAYFSLWQEIAARRRVGPRPGASVLDRGDQGLG